MTYGQLRLILKKLAPGVDQEILDGWIQDRYVEILDRLPWKRLESESTIAAPDSYSIGTLTATEGSSAITGLGTTWTVAMNGRMIRIAAGQEYYIFTYVSSATATLDRPYEGSTGAITGQTIAAAGTGYAIGDQVVPAGGNGMALYTVGSIGVGGSVTSLIPVNVGNGYSVASGVATTTSGAGTGLTINITAVSPGAGLTYRIDRHIFPLPANARILRGVTPRHGGGPLELITPAELNRRAPNRGGYGDGLGSGIGSGGLGGNYSRPTMAAATWDTATDPPILQVELYPVPSSPDSSGNRMSWVLDSIIDPAADPQTRQASSVSVLPWVRPSALKAGVQADIAMFAEKFAAADRYEKKFGELVAEMAMVNALQRGPQTIRLAPELQRQHPTRWRRGPIREGYTG